MSDSATLWSAAHQPSLSFTISGACSNSVQVPLSMEFSRWKYQSGLPFPPPGDLPDPGIEPESSVSPAFVSFITTEPLGKPSNLIAKIRSLINSWWESWLNGWHTMSAYWNVLKMLYVWGTLTLKSSYEAGATICALLWTTKLRQRSVKQSACAHQLRDVAVIHTEAQPTVYSEPLGTLPLLMTKLFYTCQESSSVGKNTMNTEEAQWVFIFQQFTLLQGVKVSWNLESFDCSFLPNSPNGHGCRWVNFLYYLFICSPSPRLGHSVILFLSVTGSPIRPTHIDTCRHMPASRAASQHKSHISAGGTFNTTCSKQPIMSLNLFYWGG